MSTRAVVIVQTGNTIDHIGARYGDFAHWFHSAGRLRGKAPVQIVQAHQDEALPDPATIAAVIVTGSPMMVTEQRSWMQHGASWLRAVHQAEVPTLGVCFGHQWLADAHGGQVDYNPRGREIGSVDIAVHANAKTDPLFAAVDRSFAAQVSHSQSVLKLPPNAVPLAYNEHDPHHAFRLGRHTWGLQFHPEFSAQVTRAYILARAERIRTEGLDPQSLLDGVRAAPVARRLLQRFVRYALDATARERITARRSRRRAGYTATLRQRTQATPSPMKILAPLWLGMLSATAAAAPQVLKYYPDVSAAHIAFVHDGDIYLVARTGGTAARLTSHPGQELFPKFSPDGTQIAFSAEYNGTRQVYVMPIDGSAAPRQLTWYNDFGAQPPRAGYDNRVLDFTPDGKFVLFRANRVAQDDRGGRPYLVPVAGGMETPLAVPETGGGTLSPDGQQYVYTPIDREFRTWKRYRGGRAQDVWVYDLQANDSKRLTDFAGTDNQPTWVGDTVYYTSDRGQRLNLWSIPAAGGTPTQVTNFDDFDVLFPSSGGDAVVFTKGGEVWLYAPGAGAPAQVSIAVPNDRPQVLPTIKNVAAQIDSMALSPKSERLLVAARGEIFSVPAKNGAVRNLTQSSAREIDVTLSADGKSIAYLSDASGEYEIYTRSSHGRGDAKRITRDGSIWRFAPTWSPDSKWFAVADKKNRLQLIDAATGEARTIDTATRGGEIQTYVFAPDSRWIAYVKDDDNDISRVWLYDIAGGRSTAVTLANYPAGSPAFDPKGRWLYFTSNRDYNLIFGAYEFNYLYANGTRVYAASLSADADPIDAPFSDEIGGGEKKLPSGQDGDTALKVDVSGMAERAVALRHSGGTYGSVSANKDAVFYLGGNPQEGNQSLRRYDLLSAREEIVSAGVAGYTLSADGDKIAVLQPGKIALVEAKANQDLAANQVSLSTLTLKVDPRVEWQQIYVDAWRILRDWFYDEGLHGNDWPAIRQRYQPLVDAAVSRDDLDFVLGELAGEMNAGHVYVNRGDSRSVERNNGALLGANIVADRSGFFQIEQIFPGESWTTYYRNPLRHPSVRAQAGDYIVAVDGVDTRSVKNFYALLDGKGGQTVRLSLNRSATLEGAREVDVQPVTSETSLRYLEWVETRRALVDQLSGGRIGYIHLPNTAVEGNRELYRQLLPQFGKEALIIDDRYNGGGFIPDRMIELLSRPRLNYWKRRGLDPQATPVLSHQGPKAMLINGLSSSGGDALPYYFRKLGMGKLIGTRTWGGLIGISGNPSLVDGGSVLAATFRILSTEGEWVVENEGVAPDIEVIDAPHLLAQGKDPSVERAVQELLQSLPKDGATPAVSVPNAPRQFGE